MKDHNAARLTLGRLIRQYHAGELESQTFRDLVYSFNVLLSFFKHASDLEIESRLTAIEDRLSEEKQEAKL
jgi:hypothetical protein